MKNFLITSLVCILSLSAFSQKEFPLTIAIGNEATAVPYTRFFTTPVHPTFQIGTEFLYKQGPHFRFYQTANVGYIFHNYLYQGYYLNSAVAYDYIFSFGLVLKARFGLGFLHTFATQEEYQFKDGEYVSGPDWGNVRLMPGLSLGLGYRFNKTKPDSPEIFVLYKSWVEYPYSPGFIPVMTHINLDLGVRFYIKRKK
jgi:hypothetical protein